ncbi:MAG TPA: hypothetical protein VGC22_10510 [Chitinophaga sp.]
MQPHKYLLLLGGWCLFLLFACKKSGVEKALPPDPPTGPPAAPTYTTWSPWIAISNTANKTIEVYNADSTTWDAGSRNWLFSPTTALGYSSGAIAALGDGVGDMRLHYVDGFPGKASSAFVIQGGTFLGVGAYTPQGGYVKGQELWQYTFPAAQDPNNHAVELLPDGNIVVAGFGDGTATSQYGNWIRVYNTADATGSTYAQADIIAPHALLYDTAYHRLWVGGEILINGLAYHGLFAYIIGGTRANPTITEDVDMRAVLRYGSPTIATDVPDHLKFPHDLAADFDDANTLIYGDHTGVYNFNKTTKVFIPTPGASHLYSGMDVKLKSVGKQATAYYVSTNAYNPSYEYETNRVDFFDPATGELAFSRTVPGFTIYRARIWTHAY